MISVVLNVVIVNTYIIENGRLNKQSIYIYVLL